MSKETTLPPVLNRIPYKLIEEKGELLCQWLYVGDATFTDPFFEETIRKCTGLKENQAGKKRTSTFDELEQLALQTDAPGLTAFIFHVSRCGSTMLSQSLSADPQNTVLAEVPLIDELLRLPYTNKNISAEEIAPVIKACIQLMTHKRTGAEKNVFIKLDSWDICFYELFRKLYPAVPFFFLYRLPTEVLRSNQKQRGMQAVPGLIEPAVFGFKAAEAFNTDLDDYFAKVLEVYFSKMLAIAKQDKKCFLLNYKQGNTALLKEIEQRTGFVPEPLFYSKIEERSRFHSKDPNKVFAEAQEETAPAACLQKATQLYEQLETKRLKPV